jgi:hypothetical protein
MYRHHDIDGELKIDDRSDPNAMIEPRSSYAVWAILDIAIE